MLTGRCSFFLPDMPHWWQGIWQEQSGLPTSLSSCKAVGLSYAFGSRGDGEQFSHSGGTAPGVVSSSYETSWILPLHLRILIGFQIRLDLPKTYSLRIYLSKLISAQSCKHYCITERINKSVEEEIGIGKGRERKRRKKKKKEKKKNKK